MKRVCIVFPEDLIQLADEHKDRYHGSRSQLLREALIEYVDRLEEEENERDEMRPLVRRLERLEKSIERVAEKVSKYRGEIEYLSGHFQDRARRVAEDIESLLLEEGEGLTIPDMGEYLPHEQNELIEGVEMLEETFKVKRIESENSLPKWRIRGCGREDDG